MTTEKPTSDWTGIRARLGALHFDSPLRKFRESSFLDQIFRLIQGNEVVLDVGAGTGFFGRAVAKRLSTGKVICLELSEDMLRLLERRAEKEGVKDKIEPLNADAASSGLEDESVDLVISSSLLHELPDPEAVLREILRVLKPGGWVLIKDFRKDSLQGRLATRHHKDAHGPFYMHELEELLRKVGLSDVTATPDRSRFVGMGRK